MIKVQNNHVMFTDRAYAWGKRIVQIYLPAMGAAYFSLANLWHLPAAEQVIGTDTIICTLLGVCLGLSSKSYDASGVGTAGDLVVTHHEDAPPTFTFQMDKHPQDMQLQGKTTVNFKVKHRPLKATREDPA